MDEYLCFGDFVSLYSDEQGGFVFANHSSSVFNEVAVSYGGEKKKPIDGNVLTFEVCPPTRYQFTSHYRDLLNGTSQDGQNSNQAVFEAEQSFNKAEIKRQRGRPVCFGQTIQFRHKFTQKFIQVSNTSTSDLEKENRQVSLQPGDSIHGQFKVLPKHKYRKDGDKVRLGERVLFESVSCPSNYLHVSNEMFNSENKAYNKNFELNMSSSKSTFKVLRNSPPLVDDETELKNGDVVRFFHTEKQGYLVAEGFFGREFRENVHLRLRPLNRERPHSLQPSTSAITYWQIELVTHVITDGYVGQGSTIRLLHMCTQKYLCLGTPGKVTLTSDPKDVRSHFKLVSVEENSLRIKLQCSYSIENTQTRHWIHATEERYKKMQKDNAGGSRPLESLPISLAELLAVSSASETSREDHFSEKRFEDLFVLEKVADTDYLHYTYVAGMVPCMFKKDVATVRDANTSRNIAKCFTEMITYLAMNDKPVKTRQKLCRNLGIIERMLEILEENLHPQNEHMCTVFGLVYDVLRAYVRGNSRKNKSHVARHMSRYFSHFQHQEGQIHQHAVDMVNEFIKDNMDVVEKITNDDMTKLVDLIRRDKEYRFLELMDNFCVCQNKAVKDNQNYITNSWLKSEAKNCLFFTKMGRDLGKQEPEASDVYITVDNARSWLTLKKLTQNTAHTTDCQFFYHQLKTFERLCYGRNEMAITTLTSELNYITTEEARICLTNTELPESLRALYCQLIIAVYVNTNANQVMVHPTEELFFYNLNEQHKNNSSEDTGNNNNMPDGLKELLQPLTQFLDVYIAGESIQTTTKVETNKLTAQVLSLLNHLTPMGLHKPHKPLINCLIQLLSGQTDKPDRATESEIQTYRSMERFKKSDSTAALVETKIQCLCVLETYFEIVLRERIKELTHRFKGRRQPGQVDDVMNPDFKVENYNWFIGEAKNILEEVFSGTALFGGLELPSIMVDLTKYDYDNMVTKTMETFHTFFSAVQTFLKHAGKIQMFIDPDSIQKYESVKKDMASLKGMIGTKVSDSGANKICNILQSFAEHCVLKKGVPHQTLQNFIFSQGILDVILTVLTSNEFQETNVTVLQDHVLMLLANLVCRNEQIQGHVFNRLDFLLTINKHLNEVFPVVKAVFDGNIHTCKQVTDHQVKVIVRCLLGEERRLPYQPLFDILQTVIQPDRHAPPLRRNQNLVMRHMGEIRAFVSSIFGLDEHSLMNKITDKESNQVAFYLETVDLMASCAKNGSEESKVALRSVLDVNVLLGIIKNTGLPYDTKRPFVRTFTYAYCEGLQDADDSWVTEESTKIEAFFKYIQKDLRFLSEHSEDFLQNADNQEIIYTRDKSSIKSEKLLHQFDTIVPFCLCFCTCKPEEKTPNGIKTEMKNLCKCFKEFLTKLPQSMLSPTLRSQLIECMRSMKAFVKWEEDIGELLKMYTSEISRTTATAYEKEVEANEQYHTFVRNLTVAAEGIDIPVQETWKEIKNRKLEYSKLEKQKHLTPLYGSFVGGGGKLGPGSFAMTEKIIIELKHAKSVKLHGEVVFPKPELHQKYMQALQAILLKEIIKLPSNFAVNLRHNRRKLDRVSHVQMTLVDFGAVECALQDMSPHLSDFHLRESLHLLNYLLFNGNLHSQDTIFKFFIQRPDVLVISTLQSRIARFKDLAMETEPNRRPIPTSPTDREPETVSSPSPGPENQDSEKVGDDLGPLLKGDSIPMIPLNREGASNTNLGRWGQNKVHPLGTKEKIEKGKAATAAMKLSDVERGTIEVTSLTVDFVTSLCENQHTELQNYFREQPPIELSTNFVDVLVDVIDTVHTRINSGIINVVIKTFNCLAKVVSGNTDNKSAVLHTRVCEQTNFMLFMDEYRDCSPLQVYKLKKSVGVFLRAMTEDTCVVATKGGDSTVDLASTAIEYLDSEVVLQIMKKSSEDQKKSECRKIRSLVKSVGFQFCLLLERKLFKFPDVSEHDILKTEEDKLVFETFSESTRSVELLKDDTLHKVFFRVKDKDAFSGDIQEKIKYDVDRSSPIQKIKDFMKWSQDTTDYARNRWQLCNSPVGRLLVYSWLPFNYLMLLLTVAILIMIGIDYDGGPNSSKRYEVDHDHKVGIAVYALGGVHNFLSLVIVICFILLNQPRFFGMIHMFEVTRHIIREGRGSINTVGEEMRRQESRLKVNVFGLKMIYYVLFLTASICGTALDGFTFALCLLQIVELNQYLKRICRSVLHNVKYLLMVVLLGLIILYIYAILTFLFLREAYVRNEDGHYCNSMPQCFVTILHHALVGTAYNMLVHNTDSTPSSFGVSVWIGVYNLSFFIIITILGLYIILAIIVDGFMFFKQRMRSAKDDFRAMCFICGRPNADFSLAAKAYDDHVKGDHNIWDYIYFFIHLDTTATTDYSALDYFVYKQMCEGKYDFLPINRAICLEESDKVREKMVRTSGNEKDRQVLGHRKQLKALPSFKDPKPKETKTGKATQRDEGRHPGEKPSRSGPGPRPGPYEVATQGDEGRHPGDKPSRSGPEPRPGSYEVEPERDNRDVRKRKGGYEAAQDKSKRPSDSKPPPRPFPKQEPEQTEAELERDVRKQKGEKEAAQDESKRPSDSKPSPKSVPKQEPEQTEAEPERDVRKQKGEKEAAQDESKRPSDSKPSPRSVSKQEPEQTEAEPERDVRKQKGEKEAAQDESKRLSDSKPSPRSVSKQEPEQTEAEPERDVRKQKGEKEAAQDGSKRPSDSKPSPRSVPKQGPEQTKVEPEWRKQGRKS